jgi:hypothetical protein
VATRRGLSALVIAGVLLWYGCSSTNSPSTQSASTSTSIDRSTFASAVCGSITAWMNRMVDTTNSFSDDSPKLSVPARRDRYVAAFDTLTALTADLQSQLDQAPEKGTTPADAGAVRSELTKAGDLIKTQIAGNRAEAGGLSDAAYGFQAVNDGHLFTGTEKALSTMLKALNEQGRAHALPELEGTCGRR